LASRPRKQRFRSDTEFCLDRRTRLQCGRQPRHGQAALEVLRLDSAAALIPPDFKSVPIVVICRDRLTPLLELLHWLDDAGYRRVLLVDNGSTYQPLVEFLDTTEAEVVRLDANFGHIAPWRPEVRARLDPNSPFVVTDCDVVPDASCPPDVVEHLAGLLLRYAGVVKAGLGLRIDDLPESYSLKSDVRTWESLFWETEIAPGVFRAPVDTTFALCRSPADGHLLDPALRTGPPYVGRHLPWYADTAQPADEDRYYLDHAERAFTHWGRGVLDKKRLSCWSGGDSSVRERDLDAGAAEVDHRDQRVGGVESVCAV
jgi:hypothetical protein